MSTLTSPALERVLKTSGIPFRHGIPLSACGTWRIGGPADLLVEPMSCEQVTVVLRCAAELSVPAIVIGKGSNLLFDDAGFRGVVIRVGRGLARVTVTGTTVRAESGVSASRLARAACAAGLSGFEHIVGIPGTLGGLIFMNGGSLQRTIGEAVTEVNVVNRQGTPRTLRREDCDFAYRSSRFQREDWIITEATMNLVPGRRQTILAEMLQILRERRRKLPLTQPNCGSVFKNNPEVYDHFGPPGKIVEDAGLKGVSVGGAAVSERHANFIVNQSNATARDVLELIELIRHQVAARIGLALECEVRFVHSTGGIQPIGFIPNH